MQVVVVAHHAQDPPHRVGRNRPVGEGEHLVRQGKRVPHSPVGLSGHQAERLVGGLHSLPLQHLPNPRRDVQDPDAAKVEALTPREDGCGRLLDLLRFGGCKDEVHPRRWLLQHLQEGVPGLPGEHVGLIDDVDLVPVLVGGRIHGPLPEVPCILHSPVRGGIDFHHVQRRGPAPDPGAVAARPAGLAVLGPVGTVEGHGQNPGQGRLAHTPGATEEVGMPYPSGGDSPPERLGDVFLRGHLREGEGPILAGEGGVGHGPTGRGRSAGPGTSRTDGLPAPRAPGNLARLDWNRSWNRNRRGMRRRVRGKRNAPG